ncbi:hypothetical protein KC19_1G193200 [Ceratodon purpureus]|uniref:Secreted protein n=1 Tax=Ceratodon purpureus TaxID=3225 RepID=A0A8T0JA14_CERPU|nr:hypothetical protein KC19_1G193200 [Ceratodon purpureus]
MCRALSHVLFLAIVILNVVISYPFKKNTHKPRHYARQWRLRTSRHCRILVVNQVRWVAYSATGSCVAHHPCCQSSP